ncbi:MAG: thermonuclease family protein [Beijerinckiaceae bacterium]
MKGRKPWDRPALSRRTIAPLAFLVGFLVVWRFAQAPELSASQSEAAAKTAVLIGRATVVDGDTIRIAGESIRFNGIDAPESRQTCTDERGTAWRCGADAANRLDAYLASSRPTRCVPLSRDQYNRVIADCYRADGQNVAGWLVRNGLALDWPRFSNGRYRAEQDSAQRARLGMWRGSFQAPWEWRARRWQD